MRNTGGIIGVAATVLALLGGGCEPGGQPEGTEPAPGTVASPRAESARPGGPADEARRELAEAREEFADRDFDDAADDLRDAAGYMREAAQVAAGGAGSRLDSAAVRMDRLADEVRRGAVRTIEQMDLELARAHYALSRYHHEQAAEAWSERELEKTGRELTAAGDHLEAAAQRAGQELDEAGAALVRGARRVGAQLQQRAAVADQQVEEVLASMRQEIDRRDTAQ